MRKLILTSAMALGLAAIGIALTGPASAQMAHTGGAYASRAHGILVASREQSFLA